MAFNNKQHRIENSREGGFGIGAYDYIKNTYDANDENLETTEYFRGGVGEAGTVVAVITFTYDANDNLLTTERTS